MIKTKGLRKSFKGKEVIKGINLAVSKGKIHGFVGPNGAGKTTTIKILIGALIPTKGMGTICGYPIGSVEAKRLIGYTPENTAFCRGLTAMEYLIYLAGLSGLNFDIAKKRAYKLLTQFSLLEVKNNHPSTFSSGMKKKLMLAGALIHHPQLLILDEPTANLDPETRRFIIRILKKLVKEEKMTIFISSHILTELELLVDEVSLINEGEIILTGDLITVKNRFKQGIIEVKTNDNFLLKATLERLDYIDEVKVAGKNLLVYTQEIKRFKQEIGKILYDIQLELHLFNEERLTLDDVYEQVFKREGENHVHL